MVLLNPFQRVVVPHVDAGLYVVKLTFLRTLLDLLPVRLTVGVERLLSELPGAFHTGLFLEAVGRRAIIVLHGLKVGNGVLLLQGSQPGPLLQTDVCLDVHRAILSLLQLAVNIPTYCGPLFEVLFGVTFGVIVRDKPVCAFVRLGHRSVAVIIILIQRPDTF